MSQNHTQLNDDRNIGYICSRIYSYTSNQKNMTEIRYVDGVLDDAVSGFNLKLTGLLGKSQVYVLLSHISECFLFNFDFINV